MVLGPDIGSAMSWLTTVMLQNGGGIVGGGEGLGVTRGGGVVRVGGGAGGGERKQAVALKGITLRPIQAGI